MKSNAAILLLSTFYWPWACGNSYIGTNITYIRAQAQTIYDVSDAALGEWVVIPDLNFSCTGNIIEIWFLARKSENNSVVFPEFQVWNNGSIILLKYKGELKDYRSSASSSNVVLMNSNENFGLYKYTLESSLHVEPGDVFGLRHRQNSSLTILYQDGGGFKNYYFSFDSVFLYNIFTPDRYPLIALKSDSVCGSGFLSIEGLQEFMKRDSRDRNTEIADIPMDGLSYIFPSLEFTDNGYIENWVFAGALTRSSVISSMISFQIWRVTATQTTLYNTTTFTGVPSYSGYANVYEYSVVPHQQVQKGDFIGIQISPFSVNPKLQWIPGAGEQYQRVIEGLTELVTLGFSVPLFAAQLGVEDTKSLPRNCTQPTSFPLCLPSATTTTTPPKTEFQYLITTFPATLLASTNTSASRSVPSTTVVVEESSEDIAEFIIIVAPICGVLVIITIGVALIIFTTLLYRKRRVKTKKKSPFYDTASTAPHTQHTGNNIQTSANVAYSSDQVESSTTPVQQNPGDVTTVVWNTDYESVPVSGSTQSTKKYDYLEYIVMTSSLKSIHYN